MIMLRLAMVGGARIGCPRAKVSMMIIGAPQCGQTKVGWTMATGASGGCGSAAVGDDVQQFARPGEIVSCARHWRAARSGGCGGSRRAARAAGSGA